jgi:hypothetical protein
MLDIICTHATFDFNQSSNLVLTNKLCYELLKDDLESYCYGEFYMYMPDLIEKFENSYGHFTNFYKIIYQSDIKLKKLLTILHKLDNIYNKKIKNYKSILRPLLTGELILSNYNKYTLYFINILRDYIINKYPNNITKSNYIYDWFILFVISYSKLKNLPYNKIYVSKYIDLYIHDFNYKVYITKKLGKKEKYYVYQILLDSS